MRKNDAGYVYLLCDGEKFKIGMTRQKNIESRIKELQTGNPNEIWIRSFFYSKFPNKVEKMMHARHSNSNIKNEWFDMDVKDIVEFKEECQKCEKIIESIINNPFI